MSMARLHAAECLQVVSMMCQVCTEVVKQMPVFAKGDAHTLIVGMVDKLSDTKIQPHAWELLSTMAEVRAIAHRRWMAVVEHHLQMLSLAIAPAARMSLRLMRAGSNTQVCDGRALRQSVWAP
jgi:hypothetical protein